MFAGPTPSGQRLLRGRGTVEIHLRHLHPRRPEVVRKIIDPRAVFGGVDHDAMPEIVTPEHPLSGIRVVGR